MNTLVIIAIAENNVTDSHTLVAEGNHNVDKLQNDLSPIL